MSVLILPNRFKQQPQYAAPLNRGSALYSDIAFAYSAGRGLQDGRHPGVLGSTVGSILHRYGSGGRYVSPADGSSYIQFPSVDDYNVLGNITVVARVRVGALGAQQAIAIKSAASGGYDTPFAFLIEADGSIALNRAGAPGGTPFRVWASSAKLAAGQSVVIAATQGADISVAPLFYIDGARDTGTAASLYGGSGIGAPTSTTQPIQIGNRTDLASRFTGNIFDIVVIKELLSSPRVSNFSRNIDQIWLARARRLWAVSAYTEHLLTVENAIQGNSTNSVGITQNHTLLGSTSDQSNNIISYVVTQDQKLVLSNSTQSNISPSVSLTVEGEIDLTVSNSSQRISFNKEGKYVAAGYVLPGYVKTAPKITQVQVIGVDYSSESHDSKQVGITQSHELIVSASTHESSSKGMNVSLEQQLSAQNNWQGSISSQVGITQVHSLIYPTLNQTNDSKQVGITQSHELVLAGSNQEIISEYSNISIGQQFLTQNSKQYSISSGAAVTQIQELNPEDSLTTNESKQLTITQAYTLTGNNSSQNNTSVGFDVTQEHSLTIPQSLVNNVSPNKTITQIHELISSNVSQGNTNNSVAISVNSVVVSLTASNSSQLSEAYQGLITQAHQLISSNCVSDKIISNAIITQDQALVVSNNTTNNASSVISISQDQVLISVSSSTANSSQSMNISLAKWLVAVNAIHSSISSSGEISQVDVITLAPLNSIQEILGEISEIQQSHVLNILSGIQNNSSPGVTLSLKLLIIDRRYVSKAPFRRYLSIAKSRRY